MNAQKFNHLLKKIKYDKNAAEPIYDECSLELQAHIQRRFGELINSEDVVQEIFLKLIEIETPQNIKYPTAWLFKLADNYVIDRLREKIPTEELDELIEEFDIDKTILDLEVKRALSKLDKLSQQIIYLHYWEGYSLKELATEFNLSYGSIRTKVSRAYDELKKYM